MKKSPILDKLKIAAGQHAREKNYWMKKISGNPVKSNFPYDIETGNGNEYPGKNINEGKPGVLTLRFARETGLSLIKLSNQSDVRLYMILSAGLAALLYRYLGSTDITVGMPIYKQDTDGDYINRVLALRNRLKEPMTFKELLNEVRQTIIEAIENQDYPIELLVEDLNIPGEENEFPLFDIVILLENIHDKRYIQHIHSNITFSFNRKGEYIAGVLEYNPILYSEAAVKRITGHLERLLAAVLGDLDLLLASIEILSGEESAQLLRHFNDTTSAYPADQPIHKLFEDQVGKTPDNIAIIGTDPGLGTRFIASGPGKQNVHLTYSQLNKLSNQLACFLKEKGVQPGTIVGIMIERSIRMIAAILAVLKAGGAYLPIDSRAPGERNRYMMEDSKALLLLTQTNKLQKSKGLAVDGAIIDVFDEKCYIDKYKRDYDKLKDKGTYNQAAGKLAYVIYTSGSTGKPKGVLVAHKNAARLVKNTNFIDWAQGQRLLLTGAIVFDITTFEMWGPLLNGLILFLVEDEIILDAEKLAQWVAKHHISILHLIPQLFNQLAVMNHEIFARLNYFLIGGDLVRPHYVNKIRNRYKNLKILHMYGPTENTTFSTFFTVDKDFKITIPIGKPISNSRVYIVDKHNQLVPIGVPGELLVGGDGVALGYLNNPELTAEKFILAHSSWLIADRKEKEGTAEFPMSCQLSAISYIYKTGDLARWLPDGNIEFLGRRDYQVKIRGIRIELGEIESQLLKHEKIKEAVVIDRESAVDAAAGRGSDGEKYLCAYIVPHPAGAFDHSPHLVSQLREYLSEKLADFMIPHYFIFLELIPLTSNGKVDRKALPGPKIDAEGEYAAPRDEVEKTLAKIWSNVLGFPKDIIGINSNFFQLGGHSLKATVVVTNIHKEININLSLTQLFQTPTLGELGEYIRRLKKSHYTLIQPVEKMEHYPVSSAQKRMIMLKQMKGDRDTSDNTPAAIIINGKFSRQRFQRVVEQLIKRHEIFRTSFEFVNENPVQKIHKTIDFEIEYYEADNKEKVVGDKETEEIIENFVKPFILERPPLLRVGLIRYSRDRHLLMYDMHHIITDGRSADIFISEFRAIYGDIKLPGLKLQYKDFTVWQNKLQGSSVIKKQEEYWLGVFSGELPELNMPLDFPRPPVQSFEGQAAYFELGPGITKKIRNLVSKFDATLYIVFLSIFNVVLSKYTGQEDIIIGTSIAGRTHADLEDVIGFFVNTLAMRNYPEKGKLFRQFLEEVKYNSLKAYENQDYQFDELIKKLGVKRDPGRTPLFNFHFTVQNANIRTPASNKEIANLSFTRYPFEEKATQFDIIIHAMEGEDIISFNLLYCSKLFKRSSIEKFIADFKDIACGVIDNPEIKLEMIDIVHGLYDKKLEIPQLDFGF